ncbi:MAG TPA: SGNH/GDSL hydrolase family protein [Fontimonas sp.]
MLAVLLLGLLVHVYVEGRPAQGTAQYVAMGSSFASGPAISEPAPHSPWFCSRSRDNYAHQLARLRGLALVDVTCGGATTRHVLDGGQLLQPAQIEAVGPQTELVTITIGGNDIGYLGNLMAMGCDADTPWFVRAIGGCRVRSVEEMEQALREMPQRQAAIIEEVHRRAPRATVVLLNYQTVLPPDGTCERLDVAAEEAAAMRVIAEHLSDATRAVAQAHGALFLDARKLTQDHHVCAPQPWMNGMHPPEGLLGAPLHPTLEGMTAVAQGLDALLGPR